MILKPIHELSHQTVGVVFASCHQCGNILMSSSMGIKFELLLCTLPTEHYLCLARGTVKMVVVHVGCFKSFY